MNPGPSFSRVPPLACSASNSWLSSPQRDENQSFLHARACPPHAILPNSVPIHSFIHSLLSHGVMKMKADFSRGATQTHSRQLACRVAGLIWGGWWSWWAQLWTIGPVSLAALAGRTPPWSTWTACFSDQMPQVEPGKGSYTEAARLRSSNSLRTATGIYTSCRYLEGLARAAGVTLGSWGFLQEGAPGGPAALHGAWPHGHLFQNLAGVAFTVTREHRLIKEALEKTLKLLLHPQVHCRHTDVSPGPTHSLPHVLSLEFSFHVMSQPVPNNNNNIIIHWGLTGTAKPISLAHVVHTRTAGNMTSHPSLFFSQGHPAGVRWL